MRLIALLALALPAAAAAASAPEQATDHGAYFLDTFGPARPSTPRDVQLLDEARRVFASVSAVAERAPGHDPVLLTIDKPRGLEARDRKSVV